MSVVAIVAGFTALLASLVFLADFARSTRCDDPRLPAPNARARRHRWAVGMYTRGPEERRLEELVH
ncbi:hypothetical protein Arub01_55050 [Actinomadura rubrobrunea]|uniref:Uncharacterized protein n=1 Tax=Actinomadura rubrobrunea TaxID=115335 RepID=A0A9W6UZH5_9ACTN|nr:hypothetical protein [Actinomadura rubrobrunea]GLW67262.1 hypothetical protein Arub01_55050 [Actinomadura rubrobrunea]